MIDDRTALITVTYNSQGLAGRFSESANHFETVVIVDNDSSDDSVEAYKRNVPTAKIVKLRANLGFGTANNVGLKMASRMGCTHALLMNPDCSIDEESARRLIEEIKAHENIGLINPRIVGENNEKTDLLRFDFTRPYSEKNKKTVEKISALPSGIIFDTCLEGSCFLVDLKKFESIGYFSEALFLYCEEDDISLRLAKAGYRTATTDHATAVHLGGKSTPPSFKLKLMKPYHVRWSRFWMTDRYISKSRRMGEVARVLILAPFAIIFYLVIFNQKNCLKWIGWFAASLDGIFLTKFFRALLK